jgi:four helix bundle protein
MASRNYMDLVAWQKSMDLVESAYGIAKEFPKEEMSAPSNQLRRAAVSIPANLAEGQGRGSSGDFRRFLTIAPGSLREAETLVLIAGRVKHNDESVTQGFLCRSTEVAKLINGLLNSLASDHQDGQR